MVESTQTGWRLSSWTEIIPESEIRRLLKFAVKYYFAGGKPGIIPVEIFSKILEELHEYHEEQIKKGDIQPLINIYNYDKSGGCDSLKEILAKKLKDDGVPLPSDIEEAKEKIVITTGSQQALYILGDILIDPGDVIITTEPSYLGFLGPMMRFGANIVTTPTDEKGMIPEYVEDAIEKSIEKFKKAPDFIYVIPDSDNPKGTTLPLSRRKKLYEIAETYKIFIIEDGAYREIQFGEKIPTIKSFDKDNKWVIYVRTSSKEAAVFRLGYSVVPDSIRDQFIKSKGYIDLNTPVINQVMLRIYYEKYFDKVIHQTVAGYKKRCDVMLEAIKEHFPPGSYTVPTGGFFIWWESENKDFNSKAFLEDVALKNELSYVPGQAFYPLPFFGWMYIPETKEIVKEKDVKQNAMRLSYSFLSEEDIEEGIKKLGMLLSEHLKS
ncbi:MAG: PLP-dependent aminotransferase family protein [Candidatus Njordarchaeia archaeon]